MVRLAGLNVYPKSHARHVPQVLMCAGVGGDRHPGCCLNVLLLLWLHAGDLPQVLVRAGISGDFHSDRCLHVVPRLWCS